MIHGSEQRAGQDGHGLLLGKSVRKPPLIAGASFRAKAHRWWTDPTSLILVPLSAPTDPPRHPHLILIESPYRAMVAPLLAYIDLVRRQHPHHIITVVLPEFFTAHWWEAILHNQTALRLKTALLFRPGIVVANLPHHLRKWASQQDGSSRPAVPPRVLHPTS